MNIIERIDRPCEYVEVAQTDWMMPIRYIRWQS